MASGRAKPRPVLKYTKITGTTDITGNIVLGAGWDNRLIVNVKVSGTNLSPEENKLMCWAWGVGNGSSLKMLHFWQHNGSTLSNTPVAAWVYWFETSAFTTEEVT